MKMYGWLRSILALFIFFCGQAYAFDSETCERLLSPTQMYRSLMRSEELLHQQHWSLKKRRLVMKDPSAGLCASTCGVNALLAFMVNMNRDFDRHPAYYVERLLSIVRGQTGEDGRYGLLFENLRIG